MVANPIPRLLGTAVLVVLLVPATVAQAEPTNPHGPGVADARQDPDLPPPACSAGLLAAAGILVAWGRAR